MKMNRTVAKMVLAVASVGAVTPTYAQGAPRLSVGHSVSFGSVISVLQGVIRSMGVDLFLWIDGVDAAGSGDLARIQKQQQEQQKLQ